jgi:hypothetical protein
VGEVAAVRGAPGQTGGSEQVAGTSDMPRPVRTHRCLSQPSTACPNPPLPVRALRDLPARRPAHQPRPGWATGISTGSAPRDTVRRSHFHAQVHYPPTSRRPTCPVELSTPPPVPRPHAAAPVPVQGRGGRGRGGS